MITCPKCQKQLEDGTKFCDSCGEQIVETIFCPNCGNETSTQYAFCQVCGAPLAAEAAPAAEPATPAKAPAKLPKKLIVIGAAALAAVVLIGVILAIALSGGKNNYILYLKDKELFYSSVSKIKPMQVTEELADYEHVDENWLSNYAYQLTDVVMTKDGKYLFYGDEYAVNEAGEPTGYFTLYYRSATKAKQEPKKIDSDISSYVLNEKGNLVTYVKDGNLYQHDLKDKKKIVSDISDWAVSEDGKVVFWTNEDGDLYMKKSGKDKVKLDGDIDYIYSVNKKGSVVWYFKGYNEETGTRDFFKHDMKNEKKLASDIDYVYGLNESGEFYYTEAETEEVAAYDFVNKDTDDKEYLVESLKETKIKATTLKLFYYNGKTSKELATDVDVWDYDDSDDLSILIYKQLEEVKLKLSEINSVDAVRDAVEYGYDREGTYFLALEAAVTEIDAEDAESFSITEDGDAVYYMADFPKEKEDEGDNESKKDEVPTGTLYKLTISGTKVKKTEKYADDVYDYDVWEDGAVTYSKEYKPSETKNDKYVRRTYELYLNNKKVADDVNGHSYDTNKEAVIYMTDYKREVKDEIREDTYTLNYWKNGKTKKVAEDVYTYDLTPEGELLYLKDYNVKKCKGELYMFNGKKSKKIDEDVVSIVHVEVDED